MALPASHFMMWQAGRRSYSLLTVLGVMVRSMKLEVRNLNFDRGLYLE